MEIPEGDSASHDTPERATITKDEGCHHMAWEEEDEENETFGLTTSLNPN